MRREEAPGFQPAEAGGIQTKAHAGCGFGKTASMGHGGHYYSLYPRQLEIGCGFVNRVLEVRTLPGGLISIQWIPERWSAREPATNARLGVSIAPMKAIILYHPPGSQEPAMNTLSQEKKIQVLNALIEGCSIRSVERMTGVHRDTIMRLGVEVGAKCQRFLDQKLVNLTIEAAEIDEIWGYVRKKQKRVTPLDNEREVGDQYTFVAMDAKTKLVVSHLVGKRNGENALELMRDLQFRVKNRPQVTTDGFQPYVDAVERSFGAKVDFAQLVKIYGGNEKTRERYSPSEIVTAIPVTIMGKPKSERISTSYIERQNLTMRMQMRRFTRLTNAFSKKLANLKAAVALHFAHYNFMRVHSSLRVTPAMEAGIATHIWTWQELLGAV